MSNTFYWQGDTGTWLGECQDVNIVFKYSTGQCPESF